MKTTNNILFKTINDFLNSFSEYEIDCIEVNIDEFSHEFPMDDFDKYIIMDDKIKIEKEYVLIKTNDNDNEIYVYTDKHGYINGYAFNND